MQSTKVLTSPYQYTGGLTGFEVAKDLMKLDFSTPEEAPEEFRAVMFNMPPAKKGMRMPSLTALEIQTQGVLRCCQPVPMLFWNATSNTMIQLQSDSVLQSAVVFAASRHFITKASQQGPLSALRHLQHMSAWARCQPSMTAVLHFMDNATATYDDLRLQMQAASACWQSQASSFF